MTVMTGLTPPLVVHSGHVVAVGFDVCDINAWESCLKTGGDALLRRTYRPGELGECDGRADRLSTRFAAKEAVAKALGTGFCRGVTFLDVEVVTDVHGKPSIRLHDGAMARARSIGVSHLHVSLAHEVGNAYAWAVATGPGAP